MYYPGDLEQLNRYRSPGKLFDYMASRRPIVAADYESMHEVTGEDSVKFVAPDRPDLLADALRTVLSDPESAQAMADRAYERVQEFTWDRRARLVCEFAQRLVARRWAHRQPLPGQ
jgi:glycosyltransferase involved in cell wall biosynthesis